MLNANAELKIGQSKMKNVNMDVDEFIWSFTNWTYFASNSLRVKGKSFQLSASFILEMNWFPLYRLLHNVHFLCSCGEISEVVLKKWISLVYMTKTEEMSQKCKYI